MRFARLVLCGLLAFAVLKPAPVFSLQGQNPPQAPQTTFRSTTALVEVDVVALDRDGKFVPGLLAEDLQILEDGKPQSIEQFYMVSHSTTGAAPGAAGSADTFSTGSDRSRRVFVLLFDEGHLGIDSLLRVKRGAEQFVRAHIGPGDYGGVFANGEMYKGRLTTDRNELLGGIRSASPATDNRQAMLAPFREFPRIPGELDAVRIEAGALEVVDALGVQACFEDPFACQLNGGLQQVENLIQQKAKLYIRQARVQTARTISNLQYLTAHLSRIPGRKTIVLLSEGFFVEESLDTLKAIAAQAARGGTVIYGIDGRGLTNGTSPTTDVVRSEAGRSTAFDTGDTGPVLLTEGTGGFVVRNIDDISRAFGLVVRDTSTYYVIGYQPNNGVMDGKFRKIEVKARVPGLRLRARQGYAAVALPPMQVVSRGSGQE